MNADRFDGPTGNVYDSELSLHEFVFIAGSGRGDIRDKHTGLQRACLHAGLLSPFFVD